MSGAFGLWQPQYAARGLPTFPVSFHVREEGKVDKVPAVRGYMRLGLRGSQELVRKFDGANALGVACGKRNGLIVVDLDDPDENIVGDVMAYYGNSPLVSRTPSGGHHVFYRSNGPDGRRIRDAHWRARNVPVDVLGGGFVVLPPSRGPKGSYEFIQGVPDDLDSLPQIRVAQASVEPRAAIPEGRRNEKLFDHCMRFAKRAGCFDDLLAEAHSFNGLCTPPLGEAEVIRTAYSAWGYEQRGENRFGQHGAHFGINEVVRMADCPDALYLLAFLKVHNGPWAEFMVANGLTERLGWSRPRLTAARRRLIESGHIRQIRRAAGPGHPALYEWVSP